MARAESVVYTVSGAMLPKRHGGQAMVSRRRFWTAGSLVLVAVVGAVTAAIASGQLPKAGERLAQVTVTLNVMPPHAAFSLFGAPHVVLSANVQHMPFHIPGQPQRTLRYTFQAVRVEGSGSPPESSPPYGAATSWTWRPSHSGSYRLQVAWDLADPTGRLLGLGRIVPYANNPYVVAAAPNPMFLTVTLRADPASPTRIGCLVQVAVTTSAPVGKLTFYARREFGNSQIAASSTQDAHVWNWTPTEAGTFTLGVQAHNQVNPDDNPSREITPFQVNPGPC
jgi:hypothetical protein